jgi:hypothetical protein
MPTFLAANSIEGAMAGEGRVQLVVEVYADALPDGVELCT